MKVSIKQKQIVDFKFLTLENSDASRVLRQHIHVPQICKTAITMEDYSGNVSLCGRIWASDDGETASNFRTLEAENINPETCCKDCLKAAIAAGVIVKTEPLANPEQYEKV